MESESESPLVTLATASTNAAARLAEILEELKTANKNAVALTSAISAFTTALNALQTQKPTAPEQVTLVHPKAPLKGK